MTTRTLRWILALLALVGAYVGAWALFAPRSWYADFPGASHRWLSALGAYNEHLSRDVGALYLALVALSVGAALRPSDGYLVRLTGIAWLAFSIPHLVFHLNHLDIFSGVDKAGNAASLTLFIIAAVVLVLPVRADAALVERADWNSRTPARAPDHPTVHPRLETSEKQGSSRGTRL